MTTDVQENWHETNRQYLLGALDTVRQALQRHAEHATGDKAEHAATYNKYSVLTTSTISDTQHSGTQSSKIPRTVAPNLETLCTTLALSPFERDVLLLCVGMELDARFPTLCAAANNDLHKPYPTFGLALAVLGQAHWSAIAPAASLRRWRLIEVEAGPPLSLSPLRVQERVLHYLTGLTYLDEKLQDFVDPLYAGSVLSPGHHDLGHRIVELWANTDRDSVTPIVQLYGNEQASKFVIAANACAELGYQLYVMRSSDIPATLVERHALARLWEREAMLSHCVLLLDNEQAGNANHADKVIAFAESIRGMVLVTDLDPLLSSKRPIIRLEVKKPSSAEQQLLWESNLGEVANKLNGQLESLVAQFNLGAPAIRAACADALASSQTEDQPEQLGEALWLACRGQARPRLDDLAQRLEPASAWDDLVLPPTQRQILRDIATHIRQRIKVYETWGFANKGPRGLGISALFTGASGTGKTMAAEVLAHALNLDLYRIDLSAVVSKYIGETEKNLRRVFDAAEGGGAVLLFDEADALFGKRSDVKDSHDRYANIEVSYLLQRMEAYQGLAILTTNMKSALDSAFLRRIRFIVQFPFPDTEQRAEIWQRIFPNDTPTEGLDFTKLARLNVAGGNIRNIALNAAFLAADGCEPVRMTHLLRATRSEYAKLERPLTNSEVAGWG